MAYRLEAQLRYGWVPDGAAGAALGQPQANIAGTGNVAPSGIVGVVGGPATIFNAQVYEARIAEGVTGTYPITQTAINAALTQLAVDFNAFLTANPSILAQMQGWQTGGV